ncbi:MAG: FtsX-like permease family protein [Nocardioides sp.]|uniref:FtsX-like permease family protein n=1 Tax=Nocardioides sp. TaxID=35761 RepID=UPI0039E3C4CB
MTATRLALADLRDSWSAWLAVSLTFIATCAAVGLCALGLASTLADSTLAVDSDGGDPRLLFLVSSGFNLVITSCVAMAVIGSSVGLVVTSRRAAFARLLLAGAAPAQVVRALAVQLVVVTALCSLIGNAIAVLLQPPVLRAIAEDRGYQAPTPIISPVALLATSVCCVVLAVAGGLRQSIRATKIPPVEGLRAASGAPERRTSTWRHALRIGFLVLCLAVVAVAVVGFLNRAEEIGEDAQSTLMQVAFYSLPVAGLGLAVAAPTLAAPLTRLWTRLLPVPGPAWHLTRHTVAARADRLVKSVVPVMFSVGLVFGMMMLTDTLTRTMALNGFTDLEGTSITSLMSLIGLPLTVAVAGSVGNLVMMSRQRDAELALGGVIGATPAQQHLLPALEGTVVVGTAALLGLIMATVPALVLMVGMRHAFARTAFGFPIESLVVVLALTWLITVAAALLPSLPSLRRPAPPVLARLVAS